MSKLVIASGNAGKLREIARILAPLDIEAVPQSQFNVPDCPEPHVTFVENCLPRRATPAPTAACPRWPTIPASASKHSAARPACFPRAMPASPNPISATTKN